MEFVSWTNGTFRGKERMDDADERRKMQSENGREDVGNITG